MNSDREFIDVVELRRPSVTVRCGQCGSVNLIESIRDDMFAYGSGKDAVELTVPVPVYSCSQCGLTFTTERAEILRHEAVCRHLGVLSPAQIRDIRTRANLTRERFAALTGIGTASLARWETGELIQSAGYDKYLRLLHRRAFDMVSMSHEWNSLFSDWLLEKTI